MVDDPPLRVIVALMTGTCREAAERHGLRGLSAVALGRGLLGGMLMTTLTKGNERVTLQVMGDGPLRGVTVDANDAGEVRGYVGSPELELEASAGVRVSTTPAVGASGDVVVHRDLGLRDIYQGHTSLRSGEVDGDLEQYLVQSEQMPSALRCDVLLDGAGGVEWAGGVLVQTAPGAGPTLLRGARARVAAGWLEQELRSGSDLEAKLSDLMGHPAQLLEWRRVRFHCPCGGHRVTEALRAVGTEVLREIIASGEPAEVSCRFCGDLHLVEPATLAQLVAELEQEAGALRS